MGFIDKWVNNLNRKPILGLKILRLKFNINKIAPYELGRK